MTTNIHYGPLLAAMVLGWAGSAYAQATDQAQSMSEQELYEAAQSEGQVTWYTAHTSGETAQEIADAFEEKYPGVDVNVTRTTAQVAFQRAMQEIMNQSTVVDVLSTTDIGHYVKLKDEGHLAKYTPPNVDQLAEPFLNLDPDGYYYPTTSGLVTITYNTEEVSEEDAPKNWPDLLDPKWKGKVSVGHPGYSGYVGTWAVLMDKLYGPDFFKKLEENDPRIGRSINDTMTMLNANEAAVAAGPEAGTARGADRGNPMGIIYPEDGALLMISPSAVMAEAPNPNAARLFMNFLMGPEHANVLVQEYSRPVLKDVETSPGMKPLDEIKTIRPTAEEIITGIPRVTEDWRDIFLQ